MEFKQEYIISTWDKLCRICLTDLSLSLSVYKLDEIDEQYNMTFCDMLNICSNLKVSSDDNFPQLICSLCITHMHHALDFKIKCQSSEDTLTQLFHKKSDLSNIIKCEVLDIKEIDVKIDTDDHDAAEYETTNIVSIEFGSDINEEDSIMGKLSPKLLNKNTNSKNIKSGKVHICSICQESCTYKELVAHKRTHPNTCWKCNINFKCLEEYNEHLKQHDENVCSEYGKVFKNKGLCSAQKVSNAKCGLQFVSLKKGKVYSCPICHMSYNYRELPAHKKTHPNTCWKCNINFENIDEYNDHFKEHEQNVCLECGKVFKTAWHCNAHKTTHAKDKWLCTICGQKLGTRNALTVHYRKHSGEKIYECSYCEKKFLNWNGRRYHIRNNHTFEKPFACDICTRCFSSKGHLVSHMEIHSNERRFACTLCELTFKRKSVLKRHSFKHSGEKRVFCTVCNKGFVTNHNLKVHMVTHTGEKNYVCSLCHKGFSQAHVLRSHMKTHLDSTPSREPHNDKRNI